MTQSKKKCQKWKKHYTNNKCFTKFKKKTEREIFAFCVITFEASMIWTCSAPQNDRLNFSFVKDIKVLVKTIVRNG